jgi:hypothetical protein
VSRALGADNLEREVFVLSLLLNPWSEQTAALTNFLERLTHLNDHGSKDTRLGNVVPVTRTGDLGKLTRSTIPFFLATKDGSTEWLKSEASTPPTERALLNAALFNFANTTQTDKVSNIFGQLRAVRRMQSTKHLAALAEFSDALQTIFSEQLNLASIVLTTSVKSTRG